MGPFPPASAVKFNRVAALLVRGLVRRTKESTCRSTPERVSPPILHS